MAAFKAISFIPLGLILLFSSILPGILAYPSPLLQYGLHNVSINFPLPNNASFHHAALRIPQSFFLRIMPLGASITYGDPGEPASLGRGYRKYIRDYLRFRGWNVNMVGSRKFGQFADNARFSFAEDPSWTHLYPDVEGWPSFVITNITEKAMNAVPKYKPNLILINAGTNDATGNIDVDNAGERMKALLQACFDLSPGVVVILSTLLPNRIANDNVNTINGLYRDLVLEFLADDKKIQLADMNDGFITFDHIFDGTHPTIEGQRRMASVWAAAIEEVEEMTDWLQAPSTDVDFDDASSGSQCDKEYNSGAQDPRNGMQVLRGNSPLIVDDGNYVHRSTGKGIIWSHQGFHYRDDDDKPAVYAIQAVNLGGAPRGGELDDIVILQQSNEYVDIYLNQGDGTLKWNINSGQRIEGNCIIRGIRWGDVNNDGLDDFICIDPSGNMFVSINEGTNPATWRDVGKFKDAVPGYPQARVRLGDIDGDGRLDYCVINDDGSLHCWRNGGILSDSAAYWQDLGVIFTTSQTLPDISMMRFVDINGDFRSDVLWVDETGQVRTWINQRGTSKSLVPYWSYSGITHDGMHENYLYLHNELDDYIWRLNTTAWQNLGGGGTTQKGDGAHWGDMTGTGNDDYVWIGADGKVVVFPNVNTPPDTTGYPNWGVAQTLETGMNRKALHIGDWNGDGKADIIGVDRETGSLTVWLTTYLGGTFSFEKKTSSNSYCKEGWGVSLLDIGHHFADITGSGCVDYLCMKPDGTTTAWLNDCTSDLYGLRSVGQVKFSENLDRANHRFADVNGDGRADFMWVDKFSGDASVWINDGERPESERGSLGGSKFKWLKKGPLYAGSTRGQNLHYPNLGGEGRADQVSVEPNTAKGFISFNTCPAGGDDGGVVPRDPFLPDYLAQPQCGVNICRIDGIGFDGYSGADPCGEDPFADEGDDDDLCDANSLDSTVATQDKLLNITLATPISLVNNTAPFWANKTTPYWTNFTSYELITTESSHSLDPRAGGNGNRHFDITWRYLGILYSLRIYARRYPGSTHLHDSTRGTPARNYAVRMRRTAGCRSTNIEVLDSRTLTRRQLLDNYDSEHNPDLQMMQDFAYSIATATLPDGDDSAYNAVDPLIMQNYFNAPVLPPGLPMAGTSRCIKSPAEYMFDQIGSYGNRAGMVLCQRDFNQMKGRVFNLNTQAGTDEQVAPVEQRMFLRLLERSLTSTVAQDQLFEALRQVIGVFRYINDPDILPIVRMNINNMQSAADRIAATVPQLPSIGRMFAEFYPAWYQQAARTSRAWVSDRINDIIARYTRAIMSGNAPTNAMQVQMMINELFDDLQYMVSPF
ncbi:hypothetical protein F4680DRAFT_454935 [Xylaria scruposa]|nr:hypothetical protein F4680DRAFT_454935 [Xylaria scruposa]